MKHVMFDLETWGTEPGCDIRSIGAVVFDPIRGGVEAVDETKNAIQTFYVATDNPLLPQHQPETEDSIFVGDEFRKYPLRHDVDTVNWWLDPKRAEAAKGAFVSPVDLREACRLFAHWLDQLTSVPSHANTDIWLWCKGPHFDVAILAAVYRAVGLPIPWHYRSPRDMRTIVELAGLTRAETDAFTVGTPHHGLYDAISQAYVVCEAYKRLGLTK